MRLGRVPVATQLSRLAVAERTGALRFYGDNGGAIHLYQGMVAGAESYGTPDAARRLARWPADPDGGAPSALTRAWVIREAIADAALGLLAQAVRFTRFTEDDGPSPDSPSPDSAAMMTVADMLAEVSRRREVIQQLPAALTADTPVARNPRLGPRRVHISASQWALLVRMNEPGTPRELAIDCGTSVFTTTLQVYRLITMDLVAIVGGAPPGQRAISFIRATDG